MKNIFKSNIPSAAHLLGSFFCAAAVLLFLPGALAQNLYVANNGKITEITPGGTQSTFAAGLFAPFGLAFDSSGNLYEADNRSGIISKFTPGGTRSTFASGVFAQGLAFNSTGDLFLCSGSSIYEYTPGGVRSTFATGVSVTGLAFDRSGNLFATAGGVIGYIYEFTPDGTQTTFASGLSYPVGLAFNAAGDLFEADSGLGNSNGKINEFTPSGVENTLASGLNSPQGLAFDSSGNLYESDYGSGKINEFTPGGVESLFASGLGGPTYLAFSGEPLPVPEPAVCGLMFSGFTLLFILSRTHPWPNKSRGGVKTFPPGQG